MIKDTNKPYLILHEANSLCSQVQLTAKWEWKAGKFKKIKTKENKRKYLIDWGHIVNLA